jgi:hypothetical protein
MIRTFHKSIDAGGKYEEADNAYCYSELHQKDRVHFPNEPLKNEEWISKSTGTNQGGWHDPRNQTPEKEMTLQSVLHRHLRWWANTALPEQVHISKHQSACICPIPSLKSSSS